MAPWTAIFAALLAVCVALWLNLDAIQPLRDLLGPKATQDALVAAWEPLDFESLRRYSAANTESALRWGTYRSGLYHGIRSRTFPYYVSAGLLWGSTHEDVSQLRHECRQEDRLQKYGWLQHDGRRYGWQSVEDQFNRVELQTQYVRLEQQNGWASRFSVVPLEPKDERLQKKKVASTKLSLFFYVDLGCGDESLADACRRKLQNLVDVAMEPTQRGCRGDDAQSESESSFSCYSVRFESEGVAIDEDNSGNNKEVNGPFEFQLLAQLKTRSSSASAAIRTAELRYAGLKDTNVLNVKDRLVALATRSSPQDEDAEIALDNVIEEESTLLVVQAIIEFDASLPQRSSGNSRSHSIVQPGDIELDIIFQEGSSSSGAPVVSPRAAHALVDAAIPQFKSEFEAKFEETFHLSTLKNYNASQIAFARAAFSNLMGGTGFFYGSSLVQHDPEDPTSVQEMPRKPLFSAVPSRSFFPRGFLWDEGFHQLGIGAFDQEITRDVLVHWLGLMEDDGYIAREQILGQSARRRVPSEFLVQHVEHANPPSFLLTLESLLTQWGSKEGEQNDQTEFLELVFPFLERWYHWFVTTQRGPVFEAEIASLQWRGRRANDGKLIANTLSSGLDDYPRASIVSASEMHVDLVSWMVRFSDILAKIGQQIGLDPQASPRLHAFHTNKKRFQAALDQIHWSDASQSYFDVGFHSDQGHIEQQVVVRCRNEATGETADTTASYEQLQRQQVVCPASHPKYLFPLGDGQGGLKMQPVFVADSPPKLQHVRHIGYVSIFPLLLQLVPVDSPKLEALLAQISSPDHLWSPYGLRSMSTRDLFYEQANAHGDHPYWRGSIWINLNYLALKALHYYGSEPGPHRAKAQEIYGALRENVVSTIYSEYTRTGYLWEQYSGNIHAETQYGRGQRCHPFSGWTALVVNIMAEKY